MPNLFDKMKNEISESSLVLTITSTADRLTDLESYLVLDW